MSPQPFDSLTESALSVARFDSVPAAEHWIHQEVDRLGRPAGLVAGTHFAEGRVTATVGIAPEGARAVVFPGVERLTGVVSAHFVLAASAIERIELLGGGEPQPDQEIDTRDFVRPLWRQGTLTLITQQSGGGRLVPFEPPNQIPCCTDHTR